MRRFRTTIVLALATLLSVSICSAQQAPTTAVPHLIRYSGTLKGADGGALPSSAAVGVTFSIYEQQDGGAPVWMETQNVTPDGNGQYNVVLGSATATGLPDDLFSQQEQRWLGVKVQGQEEQARVLLVSVPYAFKAHEAETLGGLPASAFVKVAPTDAASGATTDAGTTVNALSTTGKAGGKNEKGNAASGKPSCGLPTFNGSPNVIAVWDSTGCNLTNSSLVNVAQGYQISGNTVLTVPGDNLFVGDFAGAANAGNGNTFIGHSAGQANAAGSQNTFVGLFAGSSNTNGTANTFIGWRAGIVHVSNGANTFIGTGAGSSDKTGGGNTFVGTSAGQSNQIGKSNTYLGNAAGLNALGSDNIFAGYAAGWSGTPVANTGNRNTFMGEYTGAGTRSGSDNAFYGYLAGLSNSTGNYNVFVGPSAGLKHVAGDGNTYVGTSAGQNDTGSPGNGCNLGGNSFLGFQAGFLNTASCGNSFFGYQTGFHNTSGSGNTFMGASAGGQNSTGYTNTFVGNEAGVLNADGYNNTFIGTAAGGNINQHDNIMIGFLAGSNTNYGFGNIYIGSGGGFGADFNSIRIGTPYIAGQGGQTGAYIAGIYGFGTSKGGESVYISSDGKLGTHVSSRRFKDNILDMGAASSKLFQLRPVTFFYKPQYDDGSHQLQYGLIAEEVGNIYPEMVAYDGDGQPHSVKYEMLAPMLLNELQKQHMVVAAQQDVIKTQQQQVNVQRQQMQAQQEQIDQLQQRLSRLESLIAKK